MTTHEKRTRALILGGGGVAGIAWELGVLLSLQEAGLDTRQADLVIGTSAGSVVGAQITSGTALDSLFASQLIPVQQTKERAVEFNPEKMIEAFTQAVRESNNDARQMRARIGAYALSAKTVPEAERHAIISSRLPSHTWPQQRLLIVAVDTASGDEYIIDSASGVSLDDAIAASCAVPGVWPPVTIGDHRYMDGGVRSSTNADLAQGCERVLILNPIGDSANAFGNSGPTAEAEQLKRTGSQVRVLGPDETSLKAIGLNPLDPATREPSALAGREQGRELAAEVLAFWSSAE